MLQAKKVTPSGLKYLLPRLRSTEREGLVSANNITKELEARCRTETLKKADEAPVLGEKSREGPNHQLPV